MLNIKAYHRPSDLDQALQLLSRSGLKTKVLAGGTSLVPEMEDGVDELVDLQDLGLDQIVVEGDQVSMGAMVRIQRIVDHPQIPPTLRQIAKLEGPNTFRNVGTIGGLIATADWESRFYAALLVHQAEITLKNGRQEVKKPLSDVAQTDLIQSLITEVTFTVGGKTVFESVVRTPADRPIVAVVGRRDGEGKIRTAVCGVAARPILLSQMVEVEALSPPADFRGSSEYRREMAILLYQRVLQNLKS